MNAFARITTRPTSLTIFATATLALAMVDSGAALAQTAPASPTAAAASAAPTSQPSRTTVIPGGTVTVRSFDEMEIYNCEGMMATRPTVGVQVVSRWEALLGRERGDHTGWALALESATDHTRWFSGNVDMTKGDAQSGYEFDLPVIAKANDNAAEDFPATQPVVPMGNSGERKTESVIAKISGKFVLTATNESNSVGFVLDGKIGEVPAGGIFRCEPRKKTGD